MSKVTITITRQHIYSIAEGISATISQHNGGSPTFEQLWASADEAVKLDIYYREAISDLERHLTEWLQQSSSQFNLTQDGTNYTLILNMNPHWPATMQGLLANKIQDYMVHAVTAGWLNDFQGLEIKQDYQALASQDVVDIRGIIYLRAFNFDESQRSADGSTKDGGSSLNPSDRQSDSSVKDGGSSLNPSDRQSDSSVKDGSSVLTPSDRSADGTTKAEPDSLTPSSRQSDTDKEPPLLRPETSYRRKDNVTKRDNDKKFCLPKNIRHRDNDIVEHHDDWTDWSGTGIAFRDRMPTRPAGCGIAARPPHPLHQTGCIVDQPSPRVDNGKGYTPSPFEERPVGCGSSATPPPPPPHKDPRIPDNPSHPNYPPIYADGIDWSDRDLYDAEGSEHAINGKCHK
jgi:hypothetical protein